MKRFTALYGAAALLAMLALGCRESSNSQTAASSSVTATTNTSTTAESPGEGAAAAPGGKEMQMAGGLKYVDLKVGDGEIAEAGQNATVHYTGWLTDGTKFDSSVDRGQPFQFRIGQGVIAGWSEGVKGMRVGGKRHLTIPPDLGYGATGAGSVIPPNATLVFDIELLALSK